MQRLSMKANVAGERVIIRLTANPMRRQGAARRIRKTRTRAVEGAQSIDTALQIIPMRTCMYVVNVLSSRALLSKGALRITSNDYTTWWGAVRRTSMSMVFSQKTLNPIRSGHIPLCEACMLKANIHILWRCY